MTLRWTRKSHEKVDFSISFPNSISLKKPSKGTLFKILSHGVHQILKLPINSSPLDMEDHMSPLKFKKLLENYLKNSLFEANKIF